MTRYILNRFYQGIIVLLLVTIFIFLVMQLLPSDPVSIYFAQFSDREIDPEIMAHYRHIYGLDLPIPMQYFKWITNLLKGDLGYSLSLDQTVSSLIAKRLPVTLHLGILSFIISSVIGIFLGILSSIKHNSRIDTIVSAFANIGLTVPIFWIGILLIYFLGFKLRLLPMYGYTSPLNDFWLSTKQVIMPVFCLSLAPIGVLTRQTRSSMLEVIQQDYMRTAWSKGLRERVIIMRHALKNAFIPMITIMGLQVRNIVGGSVIIEMVFSLPGIGGMLVSGVITLDFPVVQSGVLLVAVAVLIINLLVDISYGWFDPRIRYG